MYHCPAVLPTSGTNPRAMIAIRCSKIVIAAGLALFAFLAALGNVTDYGSNWAFVQHVLAMDTVFPESKLKWRAINDPTLQAAAYWLIIAAEFLTFAAFAAAALAMARAWRAPGTEFRRAKRYVGWGVLLGFALWFIGFMAIGGEWFAMWQSKSWNGQSAAFAFYMTILAAGIYILMDNDGEGGR